MDYQIIGPQQLSEMDQNKQKRSIWKPMNE